MKVKLLSRVQLLVTPWTAAYQALPFLNVILLVSLLKYRFLFIGNLLHYFSPSLSLSHTHTLTHPFLMPSVNLFQIFYVFIIDGTGSSLLCVLFSSCCERGLP